METQTGVTGMQIVYITAVETEADAYVVEAKTAQGVWFQHEGPKGFAYFTQDQAERLVRAIRTTMQINTAHWVSGAGGYYGTDAHEMGLLEGEYYDRAA